MQPLAGDPRVDRSLRHSLKDAAAFATMTGVGETYLSAFAIALKATTAQIGLLASVPPLLASLVQLFSAWLGRATRQRRRIMLAGATVQAIAWLPVLALPLAFPAHAVPLLIASAVIYHSGAHLAAPQWASIMGDLVPARRRGRFFGLRTRIVTLTTFTSLLLGGLVLQLCTNAGKPLAGFAILFAIAFVARLISVHHLARMSVPETGIPGEDVSFAPGWMGKLRHSNAVRFSLFFALMQFGVAIASPFFTVYMLRDLEFTYLQFTLNTATAILAQFLTLSQWGRISDVFGNRRILVATGLLIPLMPLLWTFSTNFYYLIAIQALSGFSWAGFSLSAGNFIYDLIAPSRRAAYLAVHNVLAHTGIFAGAILGGYLGTIMPDSFELFGAHYGLPSALYGVFLVSALVRATVAALLLPRLREVRRVRPISNLQVIFRVMRISALAGVVFDIVGTRPRRAGTARGSGDDED